MTTGQVVHHSGILMVTGLLDKLLTVGLEAGADVGHGLHLNVHGEVQLLKTCCSLQIGVAPLCCQIYAAWFQI